MNKNIFLNVEGYDLPLHFAFPEDIEEEEFNSIVSEIVANFIEDLKDKGVIDINRESLLIVDNEDFKMLKMLGKDHLNGAKKIIIGFSDPPELKTKFQNLEELNHEFCNKGYEDVEASLSEIDVQLDNKSDHKKIQNNPIEDKIDYNGQNSLYPKTGEMYTEALASGLDPTVLSTDLNFTKLSFAFGYNAKPFTNCVTPKLLKRETWRIELPSTTREIFKDMEQIPTGEMRVTNQEIIESQKGIFTEVVKRLLAAFFSKEGLISMSLPVRIFEPRSTLERIGDSFATLGTFVKQASQTKNSVERLKLLLASGVAGLVTTPSLRKPFNPYLGETFQAEFRDGCMLYMEHITHHPPQSLFYITTPFGVTVDGYVTHIAEVKANSLSLWLKGPVNYRFPNGEVVTLYFPSVTQTGTVFGERLLKFTKKMCIIDKKHHLKGYLDIGKPIKIGTFKSKMADTLQGMVYEYDPRKSVEISLEKKKLYDSFNGKDSIKTLATAFGRLTDSLEWNGKQYWTFKDFIASRQMPVENPLPSDCRFREDIIWLMINEQKNAEIWKLKLEEVQRHDRNLRAKIKKEMGK